MVYEAIVKCGNSYIKNGGIDETLKVSAPIRELLEWGYNIAVNKKLVEPIELCQNKKEYWEEALKYDLPKEERVKIAKGLYFLTYLSC